MITADNTAESSQKVYTMRNKLVGRDLEMTLILTNQMPTNIPVTKCQTQKMLGYLTLQQGREHGT